MTRLKYRIQYSIPSQGILDQFCVLINLLNKYLPIFAQNPDTSWPELALWGVSKVLQWVIW
jgi:hypothetical protein